jgi:hypothetical protein
VPAQPVQLAAEALSIWLPRVVRSYSCVGGQSLQALCDVMFVMDSAPCNPVSFLNDNWPRLSTAAKSRLPGPAPPGVKRVCRMTNTDDMARSAASLWRRWKREWRAEPHDMAGPNGINHLEAIQPGAPHIDEICWGFDTRRSRPSSAISGISDLGSYVTPRSGTDSTSI